MDSDLSSGQRYAAFEQLKPGLYAQQYSNTNKIHHYDEVTEIGYHSGMGAHIAAISFNDKNNKREESANERYPSFTIDDEKQTGIPMETKYQCLRENRGNPVGPKEKGETQSYLSGTEFQEQEGDEEGIYGPIAPSADLNENAILEEINEAMKNALVEDGVNTKYTSLTIHYKKPTGVLKEKGYRLPIEHRPNQPDFNEKDVTQSYESCKTKLHHKQEGKKEIIYDTVFQSSDLEPNENAILELVRNQEQKPEKNTDSLNTKYLSLTMHCKEPTGIHKELRYKPLTEHSRNQVDMTEKDETQSCQSRKAKLQEKQEGNEEVINDSVFPSSDPEHNENAVFEELRKKEQKALKNADTVSTKYPSLTIHCKKPRKGNRKPTSQRTRKESSTRDRKR